ncbi:2-oxoacid:acceptor oxidoreductase subunit alpha [bacterium]|nr:2-oxoacid:acceptor oxidoreductase subunit alpha [bacterium]
MAKELSILIGGEAGQGIQSIGQVLARSFTRSGWRVFALQDFESRIRGGHAFTRLRVTTGEAQCHAPGIDILVALNAETIGLHRGELNDGARVIYDSGRVKEAETGAAFLGLDLAGICRESSGSSAMANTVATGAAWAMLGLDTPVVEAVLESTFARRGLETVNKNIAVLRAGYALGRPYSQAAPRLDPPDGRAGRLFLSGADAVALGALAAGVSFYSAYPMTPATSVMEYLIRHGRERGVVVEQAEDEIAAINMAIGASFMGARSMTGTSGGGFALMSEALGLAGCTEIPLVVLNAQRPGPATGMPTRTEQADLLFALFASHGEFPRVVLAPDGPESAFRLTAEAFNLADRLQAPVIILTDHHLMDSYWTVEGLPVGEVSLDRGVLAGPEELASGQNYLRYRITPSGVSPRAFPGQGTALVCSTGDEHDQSGHITEEPGLRSAMVDKRWRKLEQLGDRSGLECDLQDGADTVLVGWGSTGGALREAVRMRRAGGAKTSLVLLTCLWPFPEAQFRQAVEGQGRLVSVEGNSLGQLARLVRMETGLRADHQVLRYDGRAFCARDILEKL